MLPTISAQTRSLLTYIQQVTLTQTRRKVQAANKRRQIQAQKIQEVIEQHEKHFETKRHYFKRSFDSEQQSLRAQMESITNRIKEMIERGQQLLSEAREHLESIHVTVPEVEIVVPDSAQDLPDYGPLFDPHQSNYENETTTELLDRADEELDNAGNVVREIRMIGINSEIALPNKLGKLFQVVSTVKIGIILLIVTLVAGILVSGIYTVYASSSTGESSRFTIIVFCLVLFGWLAWIRLLVKRIRLTKRYNNLIGLLWPIATELDSHLAQAQAEYEERNNQLQWNYEVRLEDLQLRQDQKKAELEQELDEAYREYHRTLSNCEKELSSQAADARAKCEQLRAQIAYAGAYWDDSGWQSWKPALSSAFVASFGTLMPETGDLGAVFPNLNLTFPVPALIPFNDGKCLLLNTSGGKTTQAAQCLQSVMLRLLATIPPGKVNFTLIDPIGLGKNVAVMMKLAEYEESLIKSRAWTEPQHIEQRLAELTEHMETVIQKYLRTDFASIEEYNEKAGEVAEPYRVLVVMDFPVNFNDTAARRLISIAQNGPRCGVYTLIMMNTNKPLPHGFTLSELEQHSFVINYDGGSFVWEDPEFKFCHLSLDQPPADNFGNQIIEMVGQQAKEAMKVEVPYTKLLAQAGLGNEQWWKGTTARKMEVPLGPTGARKQQLLNFGEGLSHHGLIVGRPGSGKTNLMHVIITTLALAYSPDELQVYLVDFKKGVGFKPYADYKLPHAIAIAIESEREFGLSVLQGMDAEMQQRGEMFRAVSVEDIKSYREKTGEKLPRLLLVADEYQEFFTHNDNIRTQAELLLDRLTRQGRAFGIHILLGTQTLQGQNSMPKSIMNQIAVRIALQCSEEDSRIVLSHDNPAARLLSRPGEAIYNAANGLVEGNNLFQVALFTDDDRTHHLKAIASLAGVNARAPIIFEGNEPARPETARALNDLLNQPAPAIKPKAADAWLGEPTAIRPPLRVRLRRQGGSNLLIVSRDEPEGLGMVFSVLLSLAAQHTPEQAEFYLVNLATADSDWFEWPSQLAEMLPHKIKVVGGKQTPDLIKAMMDETNRRVNTPVGDAPSIYLMIIGLQRARDLREEERSILATDDDANANKLVASLVREGPEVGVHTIVWCDSLANVNRVARRQLREFGLRVATAMSADDSRALLDDGAASKLDKPHRAIFYDDERPGVFEKFRPYGLPSFGWVQQTAARLRNRA